MNKGDLNNLYEIKRAFEDSWDYKRYKEIDICKVEIDGYVGRIYTDNMFDMQFTNFSLYDKDGKEVCHATLENKEYTEDNAKEMARASIDLINKRKFNN